VLHDSNVPRLDRTVNRRELLQAAGGVAAGALLGEPPLQAAHGVGESVLVPEAGGEADQRQRWVRLAESLKPQLREAVQAPISLVRPVADSSRFLRWRMEQVSPATELEKRLLRRGDSFILDFGGHRTGHLTFSLIGEGRSVDAPVRLRLTFGEVPADVAEDLYPYRGTLSSAWLPDEIINVDFPPQQVRLPRRYAFRYVKVEVIDTSPNFGVRFQQVQTHALTSAQHQPAELGAQVPESLRRIDQVSVATLRDCMQTTFEDGPRRDQRLWIGDLRLQALTNYVTFRNYDLVKRCLYLFAGLPRQDGFVAACVYEKPKPFYGGIYIMDYAALYGAAVLDYVRATQDQKTARDLWPVVRRQMEILGQFVNQDGLFVDPRNMWIFIDWNDQLDRTAAMHAVLLYSYRQALELARVAGVEQQASSYPDRIARMTVAARSTFFDAARKLFVSGSRRQVSWATQAWLALAGVPTKEEGSEALRNAMRTQDAIRPVTPYLYHHVVDAMLTCGMNEEALTLIQSYWGGMAEAGADTFWEVYDPSDPLLSPYKSVHINSYCHAWSCTPAYFLRSRGLAKVSG
jgi:alpha-L-rhamnosidase